MKAMTVQSHIDQTPVTQEDESDDDDIETAKNDAEVFESAQKDQTKRYEKALKYADKQM